MKKYTNTLLALLLAGTFVGCGSSNDTETTEEANTTISEVPKEETVPPVQTQEQNQKMPTCYIKRGTPVTESLITVHAKCKNGNIPIDEAKVTLDNTVKSIAYKGTYFSDYIGFKNLQPNTIYKAVLEVVVGGKTIKKSMKIKTKEEKVEVTPTPVVNTPTPKPIPSVDTPPKWTKDSYFKEIDEYYFDTTNILFNLSKISKDKEGDKITYTIIDVDLSKYNLFIPQCIPVPYPFRPEKGFYIENNKLNARSSEFESCRYGIISVSIRAVAKGIFSDTKMDIAFLARQIQTSGE